MFNESTEELMQGDPYPVFYFIRLIDKPEMLWGGHTIPGPLTLYLFKSEPDALECLANRHPCPEKAEVVGTDKVGGILELLRLVQ